VSTDADLYYSGDTITVTAAVTNTGPVIADGLLHLQMVPMMAADAVAGVVSDIFESPVSRAVVMLDDRGPFYTNAEGHRRAKVHTRRGS